MTLTQSAVNGDSITINTAGLYSMSRGEYATTAVMGISVNTANGAAAPATSEVVVQAPGTGGNSTLQCVSIIKRFAAGDVVRPHDVTQASGGGGEYFQIVKVGL
jgi:hypothetical protein